jgi:phosphatidylglycerol:prolipoprotein diacylglycerol transferase
VGQNRFGLLVGHGFRIPGGILLLAAALPAVCARLRLPTLRFADTVMPAAAVALVCIRIGCFLNGCCFGKVTDFPLAITFPPDARVYESQLLEGLISGPAAHTLPVHPLQIYFALLGVLLYGLSRRWQSTKQFDGEVLVNFYLVFFAGTFLLEFLRAAPLHLNLALTPLVAGVTLVAKLRGRQGAATVARAHL